MPTQENLGNMPPEESFSLEIIYYTDDTPEFDEGSERRRIREAAEKRVSETDPGESDNQTIDHL